MEPCLPQKKGDIIAKVKSLLYSSLNFWNNISNVLFCSMALKMYMKAGSLKSHLLDSWLIVHAAVEKKKAVFGFFREEKADICASGMCHIRVMSPMAGSI